MPRKHFFSKFSEIMKQTLQNLLKMFYVYWYVHECVYIYLYEKTFLLLLYSPFIFQTSAFQISEFCHQIDPVSFEELCKKVSH